MEKLLKLLELLYGEQDNSYYYEPERSTYFKESELSIKVEGLCNEYLIGSNGGCNWDNITILRNNGYNVFAGERDSFGWLTGCVQKQGDKRIMVYG